MDDCVKLRVVCAEHKLWMGGVNYSSLHCGLAKFRGLMCKGKYGAVIGLETRIFVCAQ